MFRQIRIYITLGIILSFALTLNAQKSKVKGNGTVVAVTKSISDYNAINVSGFFDIELIKGSLGRLTMTGESNILKNINISVKNGILTIETDKNLKLKPSKRIGVHIAIPFETITSVSLSGSTNVIGAKLSSTDKLAINISGNSNIDSAIDAKFIDIQASGSGKIKLSGHSKELYASLAGDGNLNSYEMIVNKATVSTAGSSKARVFATESLSASASGDGHIWYGGNPVKLNSNKSGSGKIKMKSE